MPVVNSRNARSWEVFTTRSRLTGATWMLMGVTPGSRFAFLVVLFFDRGFLERCEGAVPEFFEVRAHGHDAPCVDAVDAPRSLLPIDDETGFLQDAQMLRDRGTRHRHAQSELADGLRPRRDPLEDRPAGGVAERPERECMVSHRLR